MARYLDDPQLVDLKDAIEQDYPGFKGKSDLRVLLVRLGIEFESYEVAHQTFGETLLEIVRNLNCKEGVGRLFHELEPHRSHLAELIPKLRFSETIQPVVPPPPSPMPPPSPTGIDAKVFSIIIEPTETSTSRCRIQANVGSDTRQIEAEVLPPSFKQDIRQLQQAILQSGTSRAGAPKLIHAVAAKLTTGADEKILREIGSQLFKFMFSGTIRDLYNKSRKEALAAEQPLFIKLHIKHPQLSYVPWEAIYDEANRSHISTRSFTPLARVAGDEQKSTATTPGPIRILGMAARVKTVNGIPLDEIDADAEKTIMGEALSEARDRVKVCWTRSARVADLGRSLARGDQGTRWDIFHFIGHGGFDEERDMGFIVVQEEGGAKGVPLYSEDLCAMLCQPQMTPKLVVLNSCSGAHSRSGDLFASVAADLTRAGIPAVVAMQFEITNQMGIDFSDAFYAYLASGKPVQEALAITRGELKARGSSEWISPVLYMRDREGTLFSKPAAALPAPGTSRPTQ
jgi:hypothetical protein